MPETEKLYYIGIDHQAPAEYDPDELVAEWQHEAYSILDKRGISQLKQRIENEHAQLQEARQREQPERICTLEIRSLKTRRNELAAKQ